MFSLPTHVHRPSDVSDTVKSYRNESLEIPSCRNPGSNRDGFWFIHYENFGRRQALQNGNLPPRKNMATETVQTKDYFYACKLRVDIPTNDNDYKFPRKPSFRNERFWKITTKPRHRSVYNVCVTDGTCQDIIN